MKNKLIGIEIAKQEVEKSNFRKLKGLIKARKIDIETAKYLLTVKEGFLYSHIIDNYQFSEVFSSLSEFLVSPAARTIAEDCEVPRAIRWFDMFFENSEELRVVYDSLDTDSKKEFARYILYRQGSEPLIRPSLRKNYLNCVGGIIQLAGELNSFSGCTQLIHRVALNLPYFGGKSVEILEAKIAELFPEEAETCRVEMEYYLERRFNEFNRYVSTEEGIEDMAEALLYFKDQKVATKLICNATYNLLESYSWAEDEETKKSSDLAKYTYINHIREKFLDRDFCASFIEANGNFDYYKSTFLFEEDEEIKNRVFLFLGKTQGFESFLRRVVTWHSNAKHGTKIEPTNLMCEISATVAHDPSQLILAGELSTADSIINYFKNVLPCHEKIPTFDENRYLFQSIKLENLSEEDFAKIKPHLRHNSFEYYFDFGAIPFKFMSKDDELLNRGSSLSKAIRRVYTIEQLRWLLDNKKDKLSQKTIELITAQGILVKKSSAEDIAKLIVSLGEEDVSYCRNFTCNLPSDNNKLKLGDILTYIN